MDLCKCKPIIIGGLKTANKRLFNNYIKAYSKHENFACIERSKYE